MTARILLADAHPLFRDGLAALLRARGFQVIGQVADGPSAIECAQQLHPDLLLVDVALPGLDGMAVARELARATPCARVILLLDSPNRAQLLEALKSGAQGCILKDTDTERFLELVEDAVRGHVAFSAELVSVLFHELAERLEKEEQVGTQVELSAREREILALVAQGLTNRQIAARLNLSENTVKYHLKNILQKTHFHTRAQAVAFAAQKGLLNTRP